MIAVIGGTGVSGSRLVHLLLRDGHRVLVVSRGGAGPPGAGVLRLDRDGDLAPLWALRLSVVVDAAGPFHAYGDDPYRLARAAVAHGASYLDFADDAGFCAGIGVLDAQAKAAGVFVLSGVSSVPGLSSAVVAELAFGMAEVDTISAAILPGNRAPRGRAVVASILHSAGLPFAQVTDGQTDMVRGWSRPARFALAPGMVWRGFVIPVPDQRLFPAYFGARTVVFRAGLELRVMNGGLWALAWLRGRLGFPMPGWLVSAVLLGARALAPFGTDAGGMVVSVTGRLGHGWVRRDWALVVREGHGPFLPGVVARAVLRNPAATAPGARPAVAEVTLAQAEAAMDGLAVTVTRQAAQVVPLFRQVLGASFDALPDAVRATHDHAGPRRFAGRARVDRGQGWLARAIAAVFRFPAAAADVAVEVVKHPGPPGEIWERRFGGRTFRSHLQATPQGMTERFGPFRFRLALRVEGGALHFPVAAGWLLGLPLPRALLPRVEAREYALRDRFHFDVAMHAPFGAGLIVRYAGWLAAPGAGS